MNWLYKGEEFTSDMIGDNYGFVYALRHKTTGKIYIGRKYFWSIRTLQPLKGKTRKRKVKKESDWKTYYGSSQFLTALINKEGKENFIREIISLHPDKRETNYAEIAEQFARNVLEARDANGERAYFNENILRVFYPSKAHGKERTRLHEQRLAGDECEPESPLS